MSVSIVGSSSVGTTVAACFPDPGYHVNNIDIDQSMAMLRSCITNKYEEASL
jgi:UDP-glucose 6-dehydrogenase